MVDIINQVWPNWVTVSMIGEGAFGKVYKVKREDLGNVSYSAVKVMHIPRNDSEIKDLHHSGMDFESISSYFEDMVKSLLNEIQIMESLKSATNIVVIEDYEVISHKDEIGWDVFIRMELLQDLGTFISEHGMNRQQVLRLGMDMCQALIACERENVIHRDIKIDNVFFNGFDSFKLGDFGISKQLERTQSALSQKGTNMYMAPEVFRAEKYDHTVDIYSLGILLYRLLNKGRFPFQPPAEKQLYAGDSQRAMEQRLVGAPMPAPVMADERLTEIILKACSYQAKDRYQSANDLLTDLKVYQQSTQYNGSEMVIETKGAIRKQPGYPNDVSSQENLTVAVFQKEKEEMPATDESADLKNEESDKQELPFEKLKPPVGKDIGQQRETDISCGKKKKYFGKKTVFIVEIALLGVILGVVGLLTAHYLMGDGSGLAKEYTTVDKLQISARMPKGWKVKVDEDQAVATYKKGKISKAISFSMNYEEAAVESSGGAISLSFVESQMKKKDNHLAPNGASESYAHNVLMNTSWIVSTFVNNFNDALEESRLYNIHGRDYYYIQYHMNIQNEERESAQYCTVQDATQINYMFHVIGARMTKADRKLFDTVMGSVRMNTKGIKYYMLKKKQIDLYALDDKAIPLKGQSLSVHMPKEYEVTEEENGVTSTYRDGINNVKNVSVTMEQQDWIGDFADGMNDTIAEELLKQLEAQGKTINYKDYVLVGSRACYAIGSSDSTGRSFTYYSVYQGELLAFTYKVSGQSANFTISDQNKKMLKNMITGAKYQ